MYSSLTQEPISLCRWVPSLSKCKFIIQFSLNDLLALDNPSLDNPYETTTKCKAKNHGIPFKKGLSRTFNNLKHLTVQLTELTKQVLRKLNSKLGLHFEMLQKSLHV